MADRPILFSGPMVRALLDGRKSQTRRVLKLGHVMERNLILPDGPNKGAASLTTRLGDRLYVREHWRTTYGLDWVVEGLDRPLKPREFDQKTTPVEYLADGENELGGKDRRAMHMPRWASRLTLIVTDVRVERLQDISEEDAIAEGVEVASTDPSWPGYRDYGNDLVMNPTAKGSYRTLWDHINGAGSWADNPWVAAYTFCVIKQNIDQIDREAA